MRGAVEAQVSSHRLDRDPQSLSSMLNMLHSKLHLATSIQMPGGKRKALPILRR